MEKRGEENGKMGKGGRGWRTIGNQFEVGNFFIFFYHLPFGRLRLNLFHSMVEIERRHDTSNNTLEFSYSEQGMYFLFFKCQNFLLTKHGPRLSNHPSNLSRATTFFITRKERPPSIKLSLFFFHLSYVALRYCH